MWLRRSPHLVSYWKSGRFLLHNFATTETAEATPLVVGVLGAFDQWRTGSSAAEALGFSYPTLRPLIAHLAARSFLERSDRISAREIAMRAFDQWNPAAGFFHTATKDVRFISAAAARAAERRRARRWPVPPVVKRYPGAALLKLEPPIADDFTRVLLERRTWRRFSTQPISLASLGRLLGLTAGVQHWVKVPVYGRVALKTAPSGGARHPIELYLLAWGVDGLKPGLYHYAADTHALELLRRGVRRGQVTRYLPRSGYFARASALILFTAVFERQLWRYPYARAYRAALIETGHLAQTFLLAATSMGLAPFCLMGLADSTIEQDLGIDGITESVLYAAGVGCRPRGVSWGPLPRGTLKARPNPHLAPRRA